MTPARRALAAWAMVECTRPRDLSARVQVLAEAEGVRPETVWRSMLVAVRRDLAVRRETLGKGGASPMSLYEAVTVTLPGPAVGQARTRVMQGRAAGSGMSSEWARLRAQAEWQALRWERSAVCPGPFRVHVQVSRPGGRLVKPDPDNVLKLHLDAIADAGCVVDDRLCRAASVEVGDGPEQVTVVLTACL